MSSSSRIFVLWALFVMLVAAVEWTIFTHHSPNYYLLVLLPAFAVGATIALALLAAPRGRGQEAQARPTVATDLNMPSALIGIALVVMLWGSFIG